MSNLANYTNLEKTVKFENGRTFHLYSKSTKKGLRYFYWSPSNCRMMPISKTKIGLA